LSKEKTIHPIWLLECDLSRSVADDFHAHSTIKGVILKNFSAGLEDESLVVGSSDFAQQFQQKHIRQHCHEQAETATYSEGRNWSFQK
jgi:hypothetical protein